MNRVFAYIAVGMILITGSRLLTNQRFPGVIDMIVSATCWPLMVYLTWRKIRQERKQ